MYASISSLLIYILLCHLLERIRYAALANAQLIQGWAHLYGSLPGFQWQVQVYLEVSY